jgi:hypothetical protein
MFQKSGAAIGCLLAFAGAAVLAPQATASSPPLARLKTGHATRASLRVRGERQAMLLVATRWSRIELSSAGAQHDKGLEDRAAFRVGVDARPQGSKPWSRLLPLLKVIGFRHSP